MITALASVIGLLIALVAGFLGLKAGQRKTDKAVEQARADTEVKVRTDVASETKAAAADAQSDAIQTRQDAEQEANATAHQGTAALDQALADKGALRD